MNGPIDHALDLELPRTDVDLRRRQRRVDAVEVGVRGDVRRQPGDRRHPGRGGHPRRRRRPRQNSAAPCRVHDVGGPDPPAEHRGADGADRQHPSSDDERAAGRPSPWRRLRHHCGRARARRSSATNVATPATTAQHRGDDRRRHLALRVLGERVHPNETEGDESHDAHPRPARRGPSEYGAEEQRHDDDPDNERGLVVRAEQGDREILQRRRETVDELGADGIHQRRPGAGETRHELPDTQRHACRDDATQRGSPPIHGRPDGRRRCHLRRDLGHVNDGTATSIAPRRGYRRDCSIRVFGAVRVFPAGRPLRKHSDDRCPEASRWCRRSGPGRRCRRPAHAWPAASGAA